jgi:hypothetical protein
MCERIPSGEKAQPVPGLPVGWNFFISAVPMNDYSTRSTKAFHPDLTGLHIVPPDGKKMYRSMEDAIKDCKLSKHESEEKIVQFYENLLGIRPRRERGNHELLGHGYHREWVDGTGCRREVYGIITSCWESLFEYNGMTDLFFSISYDQEIRDLLNSTSMCQLAVPVVDDNVPEHVAWGGFLSFTNKVEKSAVTAIDQMVARKAPVHFSWVVPSMRYAQHSEHSDFKSLVLITKGYKLELLAMPSSIPNSGLGLWVKCTAASNVIARNACFFELAPGQAVDLGCYAPTDDIDRRPEHVNLVKAFIHMWDHESWCFEMVHHHRGNDVFDITDDLTGDLHEKAKHNIIVYANETDGKEVPSLFAEHDPEGSVHYYMGHREAMHGTLRIPVNGEAIELKVDYGPKYENVRVRKGYSRLPEDEAALVLQKLKEDDSEVLGDIHEFCAKDLFDVIVFLENLVNLSTSASKSKKLSCNKLVRALVVSMSLHKRVANILKEFARPVSSNHSPLDVKTKSSNDGVNFCDNGFTDMRQKKAFERSRKLVSSIISQFEDAEKLKTSACSDPLFLSVLSESLGVDSVDAMTPIDFQSKILDMHKIESS